MSPSGDDSRNRDLDHDEGVARLDGNYLALKLIRYERAGRAERAELRAEVERLRAEILDVAQRASNAVTAEHLRAEELRAEVERLRPVYEAAVEWRATMNFDASRAFGEVFTCEIHLANATYRALAAEKEQEK